MDVPVKENSIGDGAGGGGGGGVVFLDCNSIVGNLKVNVNGGSGGNQNVAFKQCFGTGGGGGTGTVILSSRRTFLTLYISSRPGNPGRDLYTGSPCYYGSYGAFSGNFGKGIIYDKPFITSTNLFPVPKGQSITLSKKEKTNIVLNGRGGGAQYAWSPDESLSSASVQSPTTTTKSDIVYRVQVTDAGGCFVVDTFKVNTIKEDTLPVVIKPPVKKDTIPVVIKPPVKKDTIPLAVKPVRKKDTIPVVAKVVVNKKPPPPVVKDSTPVSVKPVPVKEDVFKRKENVESILKVAGDSLTLSFYDDGIVDGDSITVYLNKQLVFEHLLLTNKAYTRKIGLKDYRQKVHW